MIVVVLFLLALVSCSKSTTEFYGLDSASKSQNSVVVTNVEVVNNQLVVGGRNLQSAQQVKVMGPNGFNESFNIESKSDTNLIANGLRNIAFAAGEVFSLVISSAHGSATFQITFTLADGSVTASKLSDMNASEGDALIFNSSTSQWEAKPMSGLSFKGTWDANSNVPALADGGALTSPVVGEYYVVGVGGTFAIDGVSTWNAGDWILFNGTTWERVANSTAVSSFNGRQGAVVPMANDYAWSDIDKTTSDIGDIANVDTTGASAGKVLKFDGTNWVVDDDLTGISPGSITSTEIQDGTITNTDLAGSIDQSKINNLTTDLAGKLPLDGSASMTGDLDMGTNNITNVGNVDGVDVSALKTQADLSDINITNNATAILGKEDSIAAGTTSQYFRGDKTWQTLDKNAVGLSNVTNDAQIPMSYLDVDGTLAANSDAQVASQKAVKTYVDAAVAASSVTVNDSIADGNTTTAPSENAVFDALALKQDNISAGTTSQYFRGDKTWQTLDKSAVGLANVTNVAQMPLSYLDIDETLTANSDTKVASQKAVKTYVDTTVGALSFGDFMKDGSVAMTGALDMGTNNITNVGTVDGVDVSALKTQSDNNAAAIAALDTDDVAEATNLYFTDARAKTAAVVNSTAGTETDQAASVAAMKTYVSSQISASGGGDFMKDGSVTMTGNLDIGNNKLKLQSDNANHVRMMAPAGLVAGYLLTLPGTAGTSGQVLTTDGAGVLSWTTVSGGASVNDSITDGNTTTAPSENAVFDALALKQDTITAGTTAQYYRGDKTWQTLNKSAVGLANVTNVAQMPLSYLDIDGTLTANSDTKVASQKAVKTYVDATVAAATVTVNDSITNGNTTSAPSENAVFDALALKQDNITPGVATQYYRGDKTWQTLNSTAVGLGNVSNVAQMPLSYLDTDTALTANSDAKVASQRAVKTYVEAAVNGLGSGVLMKDGSVAMTGALNMGTNNITNVGTVDGVDVSNLQTQVNNKQAADSDLTAIAALTPSNDYFMVGNGSSWTAEAPATARTSLGLGNMALQNNTAVNIDGGAIDGTPIGATSASSIYGTTIEASNSLIVRKTSGTVFSVVDPTDSLTDFYLSNEPSSNWTYFYNSEASSYLLTDHTTGSWAINTTVNTRTLNVGGTLGVTGSVHMGWERKSGTSESLTSTINCPNSTGTCYYGSEATVSCSTGRKVIGGGCSCSSSYNCNIIRSYPNTDTSWSCQAMAVLSGYYVTPYVICARIDS